jgi:hypothetical protein
MFWRKEKSLIHAGNHTYILIFFFYVPSCEEGFLKQSDVCVLV